jgi:hypothetical protein
MGIYIFSNNKNPFFKLGYTKKENPWDRGAGFFTTKGFGTSEPDDLVFTDSWEYWELKRFYPRLSHQVERRFHTMMKEISAKGEYYPMHYLDRVCAFFDAIDICHSKDYQPMDNAPINPATGEMLLVFDVKPTKEEE